jgi:DNA-binding NarL/FixJ family response regulator
MGRRAYNGATVRRTDSLPQNDMGGFMATAQQTTALTGPRPAHPLNGRGFRDLDEFRLHRSNSLVALERPVSNPLATPLRILVADHHEVVRVGLKSILERHEGWQIVAEADNGRDAITQAAKVNPDVAIIDSALPVINGVEVARQIRARSPETEVLIFSAYENEAVVHAALCAGARALVLKSDAKGSLIAAVESLAAHSPFLVGKMSEPLVQAFLSSRSPRPELGLTPRELAVVQLIAEGHSNKEASSVLNLSVKTVESHRAAAMRKLSVDSTAALVRCAIRNRLVEP